MRFDEVVILNEGRIEQIGAPQDVYNKRASPFVIEFLGNVNRFRAALAAPQDESKGVLYVRPHDVKIEAAGAAAERKDGLGVWRICQVDLLNRVRTNPVAHLFARRLLLPAGQPSLREHAQELPNPK